MSGIAGIVSLDGAPIDRQWLRRMTDFMAYRGPDAAGIRIDGPVGFGHTMLRTTFESEHEQQPASLDGQVWITADARVDGRAELIGKLRARGRRLSDGQGAPDVELILHAYHVWGEDCVEHLLGDFAFAIWDARQQRLFCARDHFGVKPFYYARIRNCLVFSNTLDCVRRHPEVSVELNERAIGDFLLVGHNEEPGTTAFADIQRLPPAHTLTCQDGTLRLRRYWTLPAGGVLRYTRSNDYVEHFREHLREAVGDRLRTDRAGVLMSGGLDSTSVAVTAHRELASQSKPFDLRAYTVAHDGLLPRDEEPYYAGLVAQALGIPIHYLEAGRYALYERWERPTWRAPEPLNQPLRAIGIDQLRQVAGHSRVALAGYGGDPALFLSRSYLLDLVKRLEIGRALVEVGRYLRSHRRLPLHYLGSRLTGPRPWRRPCPGWLNAAFAARLDWPRKKPGRSAGRPTRACNPPCGRGSFSRASIRA